MEERREWKGALLTKMKGIKGKRIERIIGSR